jgi:hypothetical protein
MTSIGGNRATREVAFENIHRADLFVDATYCGGTAGNVSDDPLGALLPVGNQGGFRYAGSPRTGCQLVALYTSGADPDWPDALDSETGRFTYFGDNKTPGAELHETRRGGNVLLRDTFAKLHSMPPERRDIPPFFVFRKGTRGRDIVFLGLAAPSAPDVTPRDDLVAVWKTLGQQRFQNYRATFTILDVPVVTREWIDSVVAGDPLGASCPAPWRTFVGTGAYVALRSERIRRWRSKADQLPSSAEGKAILRTVYEYFRDDPFGFEACAARIWQMLAPHVARYDLTRRTRDGGRDAVGYYALGPLSDQIELDFALEAKCYSADSGVGVDAQSRLISRLRPRQFGVLVTTSFISEQAYRELRDDGHPVVILAGRDIVDILTDHQMTTAASVARWLERNFPHATAPGR